MIELRNLSKLFTTVDGPVDALKHINLTVRDGDIYGIMTVRDGDIYGIIGMSGAGKSTLVRCINMLEKPTEGSVLLDGKDMGALTEKELREMRRKITMIFQGFNLLMQRTCLKNVMLPLKLSGVDRAKAEKRARELLELGGLPDKANSDPAQLSGGQQQRVAIARALATDPQVLLCDEATSALDPKTTHAILELIRDINDPPDERGAGGLQPGRDSGKRRGGGGRRGQRGLLESAGERDQESDLSGAVGRHEHLPGGRPAGARHLQRRHGFPGAADREDGGGVQYPGQHRRRLDAFRGGPGVRLYAAGYSRNAGGSGPGGQLSEQDAGHYGSG